MCTCNLCFCLFVKGDLKTACVPSWFCFTCLLSCFLDCFIFLLGQTCNFTAGVKDVDGRSILSFLDISFRAHSGERQTAFGQDQRELSQCVWMRTSNPWLKGSDLCTVVQILPFPVWLSLLAFLWFLRKLWLWSVWWIGMAEMCFKGAWKARSVGNQAAIQQIRCCRDYWVYSIFVGQNTMRFCHLQFHLIKVTGFFWMGFG